MKTGAGSWGKLNENKPFQIHLNDNCYFMFPLPKEAEGGKRISCHRHQQIGQMHMKRQTFRSICYISGAAALRHPPRVQKPPCNLLEHPVICMKQLDKVHSSFIFIRTFRKFNPMKGVKYEQTNYGGDSKS